MQDYYAEKAIVFFYADSPFTCTYGACEMHVFFIVCLEIDVLLLHVQSDTEHHMQMSNSCGNVRRVCV